MEIKRKHCLDIIDEISKDIKTMTNEEILEDIYDILLNMSIGLNFSQHGNGDYEDYTYGRDD